MRVPRAILVALAGSLLLFADLACGVAPVRWDGAPLPPSRHGYAAPHGRPRAYGGGVCPLEQPHSHSYPPVPRASFESTERGFVDVRAMYAFFGPHPHHHGACFKREWHLHLEPPLATLRFSTEHDAYVGGEGEELVGHEGGHAPFSCAPRQCTFERPHGHRRCSTKTAPAH